MKKTMKNLLMSSLFVGLLVGCSPTTGPIQHQTNPAAISGKLLRPDGKTPAAGAIVTMFPQKSTVSITDNALHKTTIASIMAIADRQGVFSIPVLDTGFYVLEGTDDQGNAVRVSPVIISDARKTVDLSDKTLKAAGVLRGAVRLDQGGDPHNVFVLVFGSDRYSQVGGDGSFIMTGLPEGSYILKIVCVLEEYGGYDTASISVVSGDITDIGTLTITAHDVYIPKNIKLFYDTLLQIARITWDTCANKNIRGYNIYRFDKDSSDTYNKRPFNSNSFLCQGCFFDTNVIQGHSYEYRISAVTAEGIVGKKSEAVSLDATGAFGVFDALFIPSSMKNMEIVDVTSTERNELVTTYQRDGTVVVIWYTENLTIRQTTTVDYELQAMWASQSICRVDGADNIYLCGSLDSTVISFTKTGEKRFSLKRAEPVHFFDVLRDTLYIGHAQMTVAVYDTSGNFLFNLNHGPTGTGHAMEILRHFSEDYSCSMTNFGLNLSYEKIGYWKIADTSPDRVLMTSDREMRLLDYTGKLIAKSMLPQDLENSFTRYALNSENTISVMGLFGLRILCRL